MIKKCKFCLYRVQSYKKIPYTIKGELKYQKIYYCPKCNQLLDENSIIETRF